MVNQSEHDANQTDIPVGEILRRARVHHNQSLIEVERALRIRSNQLQAIEEGDFAQMPGRVYAIGFVRTYSEYLGLDGHKMVEVFKSQYAAFRNRPTLNFPITLSESKLPSAFVVIGSLIAGILFIAFLSAFALPKHQREQIPQVPDELTKSSLESAQLSRIEDEPDQEDLSSSESLIPSNKVELIVRENSWTDIRDKDGNAVLRQILKAGDKYSVPTDEAGNGLGYIMSTGNAGGIEVIIGGQSKGTLGKAGAVKRGVPLNADALLNYIEK